MVLNSMVSMAPILWSQRLLPDLSTTRNHIPTLASQDSKNAINLFNDLVAQIFLHLPLLML